MFVTGVTQVRGMCKQQDSWDACRECDDLKSDSGTSKGIEIQVRDWEFFSFCLRWFCTIFPFSQSVRSTKLEETINSVVLLETKTWFQSLRFVFLLRRQPVFVWGILRRKWIGVTVGWVRLKVALLLSKDDYASERVINYNSNNWRWICSGNIC